VPYFHIVLTLPHELSALTLQNKRLLYDLLFRTSAATLLELARDPKHLGAEIGFLGVLDTWGQNLEHHPHIHYVVPAGGLSPPTTPDRSIRRIASFCRSAHSAAFSAASSRPGFASSFSNTSSSSTVHFGFWPSHITSADFCDSFSKRTGSFTPSHPLVVPNMFCIISRAIPTASRSLTIDSSLFRMIEFHSAGRTMRVAASRRS